MKTLGTAARCALTVLLLFAAAAADPFGPRRTVPVRRPRGCSQAEPLGLAPVLLALLFVGVGGRRRGAAARRLAHERA